jgi:Glycosyltransferase like family
MISIVVCSVNEKMFTAFSKSVAQTIGVPFEIIRIDNSRNEYSICAAYNKGKTLCKYDVICFSHEDVEFETNNWGAAVTDILNDPAIGLVGTVGVCYLGLFPPDWVDPNECEGQFRAAFETGKPIMRFSRFADNPVTEVAVADGFFMVTRKAIIEKINFSDNILSGFHGYDFDICMQIRQYYKIVITRDILILHASRGNFNASYYEAVKKLIKKWKSFLPVYISSYSDNEIKELKIKTLAVFCRKAASRKMFIKNNLIAIGYALKHGVFFTWLIQMGKTYLKKIKPLLINKISLPMIYAIVQ